MEASKITTILNKNNTRLSFVFPFHIRHRKIKAATAAIKSDQTNSELFVDKATIKTMIENMAVFNKSNFKYGF